MPPNVTANGGVDGTWPVVGIWDRATGHVHAEAVDDAKKDEVQGYLEENVLKVAPVHSDQLATYDDLPQPARIRHGSTDVAAGYAVFEGAAVLGRLGGSTAPPSDRCYTCSRA